MSLDSANERVGRWKINYMFCKTVIFPNLLFFFLNFSGTVGSDINHIYIVVSSGSFRMPLNKITIEGINFIGIPAAQPQYFFPCHVLLK